MRGTSVTCVVLKEIAVCQALPALPANVIAGVMGVMFETRPSQGVLLGMMVAAILMVIILVALFMT